MTQQNAALVEESAAAATSLQEVATRLAEVIAAFRGSDDGITPLHAMRRAAHQQRADARPTTTPTKALPKGAAPVKTLGRTQSSVAASGQRSLSNKAANKSPSQGPAQADKGSWESF
jgi:hypothetical protein